MSRRLAFVGGAGLLTVLAVLFAGSSGSRGVGGMNSVSQAADSSAPRVFEMRTYITEEGRLDALHKRFREHTNALFVKHGMTLIGYWTPIDDPDSKNTLVYILAFPSREARDKSFEAFRTDPEWLKAKAESEADGPIVKQVISKFLTPTDYSPIK